MSEHNEQILDEVQVVMKKSNTEFAEIAPKQNNKLSICVIGIGNAGNQVGIETFKAGYPTFLINSSEKDLAAVSEHIPSIVVGQYGAAKIRSIAFDFLLQETQKENGLFKNQVFLDMTSKVDIIVVVCSTAGGTGSGMGPLMLDRLNRMYPTKINILYGILPKLTESVGSQLNTVDFMSEVNRATQAYDNTTYMLADLNTYVKYPDDESYKRVGKDIVSRLNVIRGDYLHESPYGMIDERDMLRIISTPGYMSVYSATGITQEKIENGTTVQAMLINDIKTSSNAAIQKDNIVKTAGIITNLPEEINENTRQGNYEELTNYTGIPIDIFKHYSICDRSSGEAHLILSGLSFPYTRLSKCKEIVDKSKEMLKHERAYTLETSDVDYANIREGGKLNKIMRAPANTSTVDISGDIPDYLYKK